MRFVSYVFLFAICLIVCFFYVQYVWMLALSPATFSSFATGPSELSGEDGSVAQPFTVQANAVAVVSYMGLPGGHDVWPRHILFFTLVWSCFLLVAFMDLLRSADEEWKMNNHD
jgi:hypothetical protein